MKAGYTSSEKSREGELGGGRGRGAKLGTEEIRERWGGGGGGGGTEPARVCGRAEEEGKPDLSTDGEREVARVMGKNTQENRSERWREIEGGRRERANKAEVLLIVGRCVTDGRFFCTASPG